MRSQPNEKMQKTQKKMQKNVVKMREMWYLIWELEKNRRFLLTMVRGMGVKIQVQNQGKIQQKKISHQFWLSP